MEADHGDDGGHQQQDRNDVGAAAKDGVEHVPPVKLTDGKEVQRGNQQAHPAGMNHRP